MRPIKVKYEIWLLFAQKGHLSYNTPIGIMSAQFERQVESLSPPNNPEELYLLLQSNMEDRRDKHGEIPWNENIDQRSGLFPREINHLSDLLSACLYMDTDQRTLVMKAAIFALVAHKNQYRDSSHPYSDHLFSPTIEAVKKYKLDEITVASALLHDSKEDSPYYWPIIERCMPGEVIETISDLSKYKGREQREKIVDENARTKIIETLFDNPRVALIKTAIDRLNNMQTVHHIKSPGRRKAIIDETQQMYVPLAGLLGLKDEERELDDLCLRQLGRKYAHSADIVSGTIDKFFDSRVRPTDVLNDVSEIHDLIQGGALELHYLKPSAHDIYRRMGEIKTVLIPSDYYLNIDAILTYSLEEESGIQWAYDALQILNTLIFNGYKVNVNFNLRSFQEELELGLTDSLPVDLVRVSDGLNIHLTIYPQHAYELEQYSISDMYYRRPPRTLEKEEELAVNGDRVAIKHLRGMMKARYLREKYERVRAASDESYGFVRRLEPRLPVGKMRVIGCDDEGRLESSSPITQGSTVMDYAKSIFTYDWSKVIAVEVKRGDRMVAVPFDYILSPGETVHIVRRKKGKANWDPFWIHSFKIDEEGREQVKKRIKATIESEERTGRFDMKNRVIEVGRRIIEQYFDPTSRPLRIDVGFVASVIEEHCKDIGVDGFEYKVGMGEVDDARVRLVAQALEPINRKVGVFRVNFATDRPGQTEAVTKVLREMGISALGSVSGRVSERGSSFVNFYIDPYVLDNKSSDVIIREVLNAEGCRRLGMKTVDFTTSGRTEIYLVKKSRR